MTKISLIDRPSSIPVPTLSGLPLVPRPRRVHFDTDGRTRIHLVRPSAALSRIAKFQRCLREHPFLVDAGFVGLTLGMATVLWSFGW